MGNTSPQSDIKATETVDATIVKGPGAAKKNQSQQDPAVQAGLLPVSGSPSSSIASRAEQVGSTLWSDAIATAEDIPSDAEVAFMAMKGISGEIAKSMQNAGHYASVDWSAVKTLLGKAYGLAEKIHTKV